MSDEFDDDIYDKFESQYARTADGQLIQVERATRKDLDTRMSIQIDGVKGEVTKAVPSTDEQGNVRRDENRRIIPRLTTLFDAAVKLFGDEEARRRIPLLCHQNHLKPVGVCRVCSVLTSKDGKPDTKLFPACNFPVVQDKMVVHTRFSDEELSFGGKKKKAGDHVNSMVKVLVEMLAVNHVHCDQREGERKYDNELLALAEDKFQIPIRRGADLSVKVETRFRRTLPQVTPNNDPTNVIAYDPNNCILCDRCVRGCSEVKPFKIIGHKGFGYSAVVSFDLDLTNNIGKSECVSCGECATSCPTGALTFNRQVYKGVPNAPDPKERLDRDPWKDEPLPPCPRGVDPKHYPEELTAADMTQTANPEINALFEDISEAFRYWNQGAVARLRLPGPSADRPELGEILCKEGEYGSVAFMIERGTINVYQAGKLLFSRGEDALILGELACLGHQVRGATLRVAPGGADIIVIKRNILYMLQRTRRARDLLFPRYSERALQTALTSKGSLFEGLDAKVGFQCIDYLKARQAAWEAEPEDYRSPSRPVTFLQVAPGQKIIMQGGLAQDYYILYRGHVTITVSVGPGHSIVTNYLGAGRHFGDLGLLSAPDGDPSIIARTKMDDRGRRTSSVAALDHVEVVRIGKEAFFGMLDEFPVVRKHLVDKANALLDILQKSKPQHTIGNHLDPFTEAGLYQGQRLLVLDLDRCTRCQECVKGCADSHDGVPRLLLEGNRFGKYLVPSACRSCHDPACMVGCPVDAIHRRPSIPGKPGKQPLAVVIEDHCIGCGLCAYSCPFGSIHMAPRKGRTGPATLHVDTGEDDDTRRTKIATNCNLCEEDSRRQGFKPQCEQRCPHDAAVHMTGLELANRVGLSPLGPAKK